MDGIIGVEAEERFECRAPGEASGLDRWLVLKFENELTEIHFDEFRRVGREIRGTAADDIWCPNFVKAKRQQARGNSDILGLQLPETSFNLRP